jgi:hypothetical protein
MTKRARKHIALPEKLAAALSMLLPQADRDVLRDLKVPAKQVIALFQFDHAILHARGGSDRWHNLTPLLKAPHREKSRRDTSIVAKVKRLRRKEREHEERLEMRLPLTGIRGDEPLDGFDFANADLQIVEIKPVTRDSRWPKRKLQGRNTFERRKN